MEDIAHADMVDTLPGTTSSSIGVGREGSCCFPSESASACFVYDESARLSAVARSAMLGALTDEDGVFQLIVDTAGEITASPMASISIVGREENFTRAAFGFPGGQHCPRDHTVCTHVVTSRCFLTIADLSADVRFARLPSVVGPPFLRFYAGAPLIDDETRQALGALCIADTTPRRITEEQKIALQVLARQTILAIKQKRALREAKLAAAPASASSASASQPSSAPEHSSGFQSQQRPPQPSAEDRPDDSSAISAALILLAGCNDHTRIIATGSARHLSSVPLSTNASSHASGPPTTFSQPPAPAMDMSESSPPSPRSLLGHQPLPDPLLVEGRPPMIDSDTVMMTSTEPNSPRREAASAATATAAAFTTGSAFPAASPSAASPAAGSVDEEVTVDRLYATHVPAEEAAYRALTRKTSEFDEDKRLAALMAYDTKEQWGKGEPSFDALAQLAADIFSAPHAMITLVGDRSAGFGAAVGFPVSTVKSRATSFCSVAIRQPRDLLVVEDLTRDDRFRHNPAVTGAPHYRSYVAAPLLDLESGQALGAICVTDYVPRQLSAMQLACLKLLAQLVMTLFQSRRRVHELISTQNQLAESNTRAEAALAKADKAMRAKTDFLNSMSHEIRTPMNAVLGISRLLSSTVLTLEQHQYVSMITDSGTLLLTIINDVLDYSKMEAGQLQLNPTWANIVDTIEATALMVHNLAQAKGLDLKWEIDPSTPSQMYVDPNRLQQITLNLLSNAIKFTKASPRSKRRSSSTQQQVGSVSVSVHGEWLTDDESVTAGPDGASPSSASLDSTLMPPPTTPSSRSSPRRYRLRVAVRDTGIGISASQLRSRLFVSFGQVQSSGTLGGTGLGLVISEKLLGAMGGTNLSVVSEVGVGSTFSFELVVLAIPSSKVASVAAESSSFLPLAPTTTTATTAMTIPAPRRLTRAISDGPAATVAVAAQQTMNAPAAAGAAAVAPSPSSPPSNPPSLPPAVCRGGSASSDNEAIRCIQQIVTVPQMLPPPEQMPPPAPLALTPDLYAISPDDRALLSRTHIVYVGAQPPPPPMALTVDKDGNATSAPRTSSYCSRLLSAYAKRVTFATTDLSALGAILAAITSHPTDAPAPEAPSPMPMVLVVDAEVDEEAILALARPASEVTAASSSSTNPSTSSFPGTAAAALAFPILFLSTRRHASGALPLADSETPPPASRSRANSEGGGQLSSTTAAAAASAAATIPMRDDDTDGADPIAVADGENSLMVDLGSSPAASSRLRSLVDHLTIPYRGRELLSKVAALASAISATAADDGDGEDGSEDAPHAGGPLPFHPHPTTATAAYLPLLETPITSQRTLGSATRARVGVRLASPRSGGRRIAGGSSSAGSAGGGAIKAIAAQYPLRILLAEDNVINQKMMVMLLRKLGYAIAVAENGVEALKLLAQQSARGRAYEVQVILMDASMDVMDGLECTRVIRSQQLPHRTRPFIIAQTANVTDAFRRQCLQAGMDCFIPKPVQLELLIQTLKQAHAFHATAHVEPAVDGEAATTPTPTPAAAAAAGGQAVPMEDVPRHVQEPRA